MAEQIKEKMQMIGVHFKIAVFSEGIFGSLFDIMNQQSRKRPYSFI